MTGIPLERVALHEAAHLVMSRVLVNGEPLHPLPTRISIVSGEVPDRAGGIDGLSYYPPNDRNTSIDYPPTQTVRDDPIEAKKIRKEGYKTLAGAVAETIFYNDVDKPDFGSKYIYNHWPWKGDMQHLSAIIRSIVGIEGIVNKSEQAVKKCGDSLWADTEAIMLRGDVQKAIKFAQTYLLENRVIEDPDKMKELVDEIDNIVS